MLIREIKFSIFVLKFYTTIRSIINRIKNNDDENIFTVLEDDMAEL